MCVKHDPLIHRSLQLRTNLSLVRIRNVIATADLQQHVDARMFKQYPWGRYDTEIYGGRCGYIKDIKMRGRVTVFLSGKMISTGADDVSESLEQLNYSRTLILEAGLIHDVVLHPVVQNMVATLDLGSRLDFFLVLKNLPNYIYEPETFPGIIYITVNGPTILIFNSGKIVIAGPKSERELQEVAKELRIKLLKLTCN